MGIIVGLAGVLLWILILWRLVKLFPGKRRRWFPLRMTEIIRGQSVSLSEKDVNGQAFLNIDVAPPDGFLNKLSIFPYKFMTYCEGIIHPIGSTMELKDIRTGDYEFDKVFSIQANDENGIVGLLDKKARDTIHELSWLFPKWAVFFETNASVIQ